MQKITPASPCPCGSGSTYKNCCKPYHDGKPPQHAETLMRARYSAYAIGDVAFVVNTTHPQSPYQREDKKAWRKELRDYVQKTQFLTLKVLSVAEQPEATVAHVAFKVVMMQRGGQATFEERSRFEKAGGRWMYHSGEIKRD